MAKLGNEAKLVMKLAHERMKAKVAARVAEFGSGEAHTTGFRRGVEDYRQELLNIADELER